MGTYDAINAAAIEKARAAGWPELTGHDRQIGYANTLREKKMREYDADLAAANGISEATRALLREGGSGGSGSTRAKNNTYGWTSSDAVSVPGVLFFARVLPGPRTARRSLWIAQLLHQLDLAALAACTECDQLKH
ncbi:hypothetical protein [Nocardia tengchongensis]|uniref:hypothetical protein n=1 Tax=Nocardia tengchongensis TaxID=2055889 RepID=UPI00365AA36F